MAHPQSSARGTLAKGAIHGGSSLLLKSADSSTDNAGRTVKINAITNTGTANDFIGFQVQPTQGAATAKNVIGGEVSARVASTFALTGGGSVRGLHVDSYLKGTAGNIGGSVVGAEIELVTDDAGARTITGYVAAIRVRTAFSAAAITGNYSAIRIEKNEVQTGSVNYDAVLDLTSTLAGVWHNDPTTEPTAAAGYFKVLVNDSARWVQLYKTGPTD